MSQKKDKKKKARKKANRSDEKKRQSQIRSFKKLVKKSKKKITRLFRFLESEEVGTLWTNGERRSLAEALSEKITDTRARRGRRHELNNILVMVLYATVCGKRNYKEIATWLKAREDELTVMLGLAHGVPSEDTIGRVMKEISYEQLHEVFTGWCAKHIPIFEHLLKGELKLHLCADGKAIRALTKKHIGEKHPPYMLNAYIYSPEIGAGLCIATVPIDRKTNEAKSLVPFLKNFAVKGSIVTIDAAGAYQETVDAVLEAGAEAVVCLKGNQGNLLEEAKQEMERATRCLEEERQAIEGFEELTGYRQEPSGRFSSHSERDLGSNGRHDLRYYMVSNDPACIDRDEWPQIKGVALVRRTRKLGGYDGDEFIFTQESEETTYYFSTVQLDAKTFAEVVRSHWYIESRLHGILDGPAFCEDQTRMRAGQAMQNMAVIRRLAYNILELEYLEAEPSQRPSFANRAMLMCENHLGIEEVLFEDKKARFSTGLEQASK